MRAKLILVGSSVRAAAWSAVRAGFDPWSTDLFGDRDLAAMGPVAKIAPYPAGLLRLFDGAPDAHWIYSGAIENHSRLVDRLARKRLLLGNSGEILRQVRSPEKLRAALGEAGIKAPKLFDDPSIIDPQVSALLKRRKSGGGFRITQLCDENGVDKTTVAGKFDSKRHYLQERMLGQSQGAVFLAEQGSAKLLGVCRHLSPEEWPAPGEFVYRGSIGPIPLSQDEEAQWLRIGNAIVQAFGLAGLFGVDAIVNSAAHKSDSAYRDTDSPASSISVVEVNPRYTASVEVLESATGDSLLGEHRHACMATHFAPNWRAMQRFFSDEIAHASREAICHFEGLSRWEATCAQHRPPEDDVHSLRSDAIAAKGICYADTATIISPAFCQFVDSWNQTGQDSYFADLPWPGQSISAGEPVLSILACSCSEPAARRALFAASSACREAWGS